MAKFGGFPGGGMPNMQNLMKQAKKCKKNYNKNKRK